jgi:hypothetical protein
MKEIEKFSQAELNTIFSKHGIGWVHAVAIKINLIIEATNALIVTHPKLKDRLEFLKTAKEEMDK